MAEDTIYNGVLNNSGEDPEGTMPHSSSNTPKSTETHSDSGVPEIDVVEDDNDSRKIAPVRSGWKVVTIGGVSGIMLGAAGYASHAFGGHLSSSAINDPSSEHAQTPSNLSGDVPENNDVEVNPMENQEESAHEGYDDMSFGQAFASARASLGPGEVFEWRGGLYTTDTREEWEAAHPSSTVEIDVEEDDDSSAEILGSQVEESSQQDGIIIDVEADDDANLVQDVEVDPDGEVVLTDVEVINPDDGSIVVGSLSIDGEDVIIVDVDADGTFDAAGADINGDGVISGNEIADIQELELRLEDFSQDDMGTDVDPSVDINF